MRLAANPGARVRFLAAICAGLVLAALCFACSPKITLFPDYTEPLEEYAIRGKGADKILALPIRGFISSEPSSGLVRERPGVLQECTARLDKARKDQAIKAVILQIDSPGGTVTDSDILYHEIRAFREETGKTVIALIMDVGASGGYYAALSADAIMVHPTSVTGSVGVIFITPKLEGLMDKIGVGAEVVKSGALKDMGSPFRASTQEEKKLFQDMIDRMAARFLTLVRERRGLDEARMKTVSTAAVFTGEEAVALGLADGTGYLEDALALAREKAKLSEDAKVVVYRRAEYKNDNLYNTMSASAPGRGLVDFGPASALAHMKPGFYYLWAPGAVSQ